MVGRLSARLILLLVLLLAALATPVGRADAAPVTPAGPRFGPVLDWTTDGAKAYADRLGTSPSVYAQSVHYPLTDRDTEFLDQFVRQASTQGALALLTLEPQ